jgi:hypothetical protein
MDILTRNKIILFLNIFNAIIIIVFIIGILGKNKAIDIYFKKNYFLNWIPVKSVLVKRDGVMLSLAMILDYIILVKPDWEVKEIEFMTQLNLNNYNDNALFCNYAAIKLCYSAAAPCLPTQPAMFSTGIPAAFAALFNC